MRGHLLQISHLFDGLLFTFFLCFLLLQVFLYLAMVSRQLYKKLVLQLLYPRELVLIVDYAPEHGDLVREERDGLNFV